MPVPLPTHCVVCGHTPITAASKQQQSIYLHTYVCGATQHFKAQQHSRDSTSTALRVAAAVLSVRRPRDAARGARAEVETAEEKLTRVLLLHVQNTHVCGTRRETERVNSGCGVQVLVDSYSRHPMQLPG